MSKGGEWVRLTRILRLLLTAAAMLLVATAINLLLIEWLAGCGESYTDYKGVVHINKCVFINKE